MDTLNFDTILETKKAELMELYEKKMSKNKTTLQSLSQSIDQGKFSGMKIRLLERFQ